MGWVSTRERIVPITCLVHLSDSIRFPDSLLILRLASDKDNERESVHLRIRQSCRCRSPRIFPCWRTTDDTDPSRFFSYCNRSSCDHYLQVKTNCSEELIPCISRPC